MTCITRGISCGLRHLRLTHKANKFRFVILNSTHIFNLGLVGLVSCPFIYTSLSRLSSGRAVAVNRFSTRLDKLNLALAESIDTILRKHLGEERHGCPIVTGERGSDLYLPACIDKCTYAVLAQEICDAIDCHNRKHEGIDPFCVD